MKTSTMRTIGVIFSAGVLLTSCVSSKKYHRSQDEVAKLRADSTALAQQASTLQQNLTATEQKNTELQKSVETAGTTNAGLQKNVAYYTDYAGKQQSATTAINDELKTTLAPAGLTDQDIMLTDGKIYVNIGEKSLFKGKSAVLTPKGKELVDNLGQFVKSHEAVDVTVADLQMATSPEVGTATTTTTMDASGSTTTSGTNPSGSMAKTKKASSVSASNAATNNNADYSNTATVKKQAKHNNNVAVHHPKKAPAASGESKAVAYSSGPHKYTNERNSRSMTRAIAWKRQTVIGDALLKNGIPKVKLVSQLPNGELSSTQKGVQVVLVNDMDNFYKHMSEAPGAQPVSRNP
jgi:outer membrane murein-binding lipoprotein Lpp